VDQDNLTELHRRYSRLLYGPDHLLRPLSVLQDDLETSGLPRQDRVRAFRLAASYWADVTRVPVSRFLDEPLQPTAAQQEACHDEREVAARDRRARSPVPVC
jgi:hypothetical protein